ncbi:hypothetical protein ELH21_09395 [Rhizobium leguminosarum]|uniref:hypothetical protein n=1 Tax=Rhizobium leguminosarum TaxID=384 RepID=UPI00102F39BA|nr:hypothetical protein [Rhizobium leguminosarum]TBD04593.1 hypothetical protein ELH21_09395 [Rhizobium leguminosarum]
MREWADVYLESIDEKVLVERNALFFIPSALHLMFTNGITKNNLSTFAVNLQREPRAGRQAISKVADCKPVVYESASGFVTAFNEYCKTKRIDAQLSKRDIVACVFRIEGLGSLLNRAKRNKEDLQRETGISAAIIDSAIDNYRIQLEDALKIFKFLHRATNSKPEIRDIISLSEKLSRTSVKKAKDESYVYRREHLVVAPVTGHPWSIEMSQPKGWPGVEQLSENGPGND